MTTKVKQIFTLSAPFMFGPARRKTAITDYSVDRLISAWLMENRSAAPVEYALSDHVLQNSHVQMVRPGMLAIPLDAIVGTKLNTQVLGSGGAASARSEDAGMMIRADVGDPVDVVSLATQMPSGPGDARLIPVTVPEPAMVAEPGDTGYAKTGDATAAEIAMAPKLLVDNQLLSRVADVAAPQLISADLRITLEKMRETMNLQVLAGAGGDEVTGVYDYAGIDSSADLVNTAAITVPVTTAAIASSFGFPDADKRFVVSPSVLSHLRGLARITAVSPLMEDGQVDGVSIVASNVFGAANPLRGICGPFSDMYIKQWDGVVFVSREYSNGNNRLLTEMFWNMALGHAGSWARLRKD